MMARRRKKEKKKKKSFIEISLLINSEDTFCVS